MRKTIILGLLLLASLTFTSGLQAQYRWNVLRPSKLDAEFYRAILAISCNGDNCIATEVVFAPTVGNYNIVLNSHDGGLTWNRVAEGIPQYDYYDGSGRLGLYFGAAQQIDSLNAIIGSSQSGFLVRTRDGWKTWDVDSTYMGALGASPRDIKFADLAEGMLNDGFGLYWSTVDSGKTWKRVVTNGGTSFAAYGDSTFRVFESPNRILTTRNNWTTQDTTRISLTGPLSDTSFHFTEFVFGPGDSVAIRGLRWDTTSRNGLSIRLALSTDFGTDWTEADIPKNNGIFLANTSPHGLDWRHMVLAGDDSSGKIIHSTDQGLTWRMDTVPLSNGLAYFSVWPVAVTGSGRVLAGVLDTTSFAGSSSLVYLEKSTASVDDAERNYQYLYIQAFPNPVHDRLGLKFFGMYVGPVNTLSSRIYDVLGRTVKDLSKQAQAGSNGEISEFSADVSDLAPGIYFVSYKLGGAEYVKQFLKY